jgi:hypothetical protein
MIVSQPGCIATLGRVSTGATSVLNSFMFLDFDREERRAEAAVENVDLSTRLFCDILMSA